MCELPSSRCHYHLPEVVIWIYGAIEYMLNFLTFWILGRYTDVLSISGFLSASHPAREQSVTTPSHPHRTFTLIICSQRTVPSPSFSGCFAIHCESSESTSLFKISCLFHFSPSCRNQQRDICKIPPQSSFAPCFTFQNKAIFLLYNSFWHTSVIQNPPNFWIRPHRNGTWT